MCEREEYLEWGEWDGLAAFYQFVRKYFYILAADTQLYQLLTDTLPHLLWNVHAQTQEA